MYCSVYSYMEIYKDISGYLNDLKPYYAKKTGEVYGYKGKLKNNYKIEVKNDVLKIENSLATYFLGNNIETLTINQTKEAIENLSDDLHLDMKQARLTRIDFANNFIMRDPPINYFSCLVEANKLNKNRIDSTLYFSNQVRSLVFYDKTKHYQDKNINIPEAYQNQNILRYERRLLKAGKYRLKFEDLYKPNIFKNFLDHWKREYDSIIKNSSLQFTKEASNMFSYKFLCAVALKEYVEKTGGMEKLFEIFDKEQRKGNIKRQNKPYYKNRIQEVLTLPELFEPDSLTTELNEKVNEAYQRYVV
jgi:hypothetical protein